ncbi:hypothetical protein DPMN_117542 [Dreissena polymorpha]|uniref:Uncharacterized protein n=1 Tax=Dreissena polymorpha TaxID=45954 RepID=A0A9D4KRW8_DREPO|nr:hypothetical protein DPMN_117542 [Dreissena polymorpha]
MPTAVPKVTTHVYHAYTRTRGNNICTYTMPTSVLKATIHTLPKVTTHTRLPCLHTYMYQTKLYIQHQSTKCNYAYTCTIPTPYLRKQYMHYQSNKGYCTYTCTMPTPTPRKTIHTCLPCLHQYQSSKGNNTYTCNIPTPELEVTIHDIVPCLHQYQR